MKSFRQYLYELEAQEPFDPKLAYHDELNPALWANSGEQWELKPEVAEALKKIADEFIEFLGISVADVTDVILTGSNTNYNWTELSDVDLHLVIDLSKGDKLCPTCPSDNFIEDCFQAKKTLWNSSHHITIHGFDVEVYAQPASEQAVTDSGIYSLQRSQWLQFPEHKAVTIDNNAVKLKAQDIMNQIDELLNSQSDNLEELNSIKDKIRKLRAAGLKTGGEFSIENLAFKALRNLGYAEKLSTYIGTLRDQSLSVK